MTLFLALLLDGIAGEPRWLWSRLPHPAVLMGRAVGWIESRYNTGKNRRTKGAAGFAVLCVGAVIIGALLAAIPGQVVDVLVAAILLAQRSLVQHVAAVANGLRTSLGDGRRAVAMIVSRDTNSMDSSAIARSAIESGAENLSDGVIAPAFWFAIAGLPGLLLYKITNTADSMIGYRTPRYAQFGWAAARFDDVLNWIPARLTALLIWVTRPRIADLADIRRDATLHRSPNAGWPEAAMARILHIALAGPRSYDGALRDFPFVNADGARQLDAGHIDAAAGVMWRAWAIAVGIALLAALL